MHEPAAKPTGAAVQQFAAVLFGLNAVSLAETIVLLEKLPLVTNLIPVEAHKKPFELLVFAKFCRMLIDDLSVPLPLHSVSKYQEQLPCLFRHFFRHGIPPSAGQRNPQPASPFYN